MKTLKIIGAITGAIIALAAVITGMIFYRDTLVDWWLPPVFAAIVGAATIPWLRKFIAVATPITDRVYTSVSALLFSTALVYGLTLTANSVLADRQAARDYDAEIIDKHIEKRTRHRRVGRGRMIPDGHYNAYCVTVRLADGRAKTYETSRSRYNSTRNGSHHSLSVAPGFLGYDIILNSRF